MNRLVCTSSSPTVSIVLTRRCHETSKEGSIDEDYDNSDNEDGDGDVSYEFIVSQSHLCKLQLSNRDDLFNHVETDHNEYQQGMMEIVVNR